MPFLAAFRHRIDDVRSMFSVCSLLSNGRNISFAFCFDDSYSSPSAFFVDRGLAEEVDDLWEPWMRTADRLLDDEQLIERVFEALARRCLNSQTRGRWQTPAKAVLRLLIVKHVRNWSYAVLEREVRVNLVYRTFARIGAEKVPDAKTLGRLGQVVGLEVIEDLHRRMAQLAVENRVVAGRRMRVDTTAVETNTTIRPTAVYWAMELAC
jgi:transposase, IS5 family